MKEGQYLVIFRDPKVAAKELQTCTSGLCKCAAHMFMILQLKSF